MTIEKLVHIDDYEEMSKRNEGDDEVFWEKMEDKKHNLVVRILWFIGFVAFMLLMIVLHHAIQ